MVTRSRRDAPAFGRRRRGRAAICSRRDRRVERAHVGEREAGAAASASISRTLARSMPRPSVYDSQRFSSASTIVSDMHANASRGGSARSNGRAGFAHALARETRPERACCRPRRPARRAARAATRRLTSCGSESSHTTAPGRRSSGSITSCVEEVAVSTRSARAPQREMSTRVATFARHAAARARRASLRSRVSFRATHDHRAHPRRDQLHARGADRAGRPDDDGRRDCGGRCPSPRRRGRGCARRPRW